MLSLPRGSSLHCIQHSQRINKLCTTRLREPYRTERSLQRCRCQGPNDKQQPPAAESVDLQQQPPPSQQHTSQEQQSALTAELAYPSQEQQQQPQQLRAVYHVSWDIWEFIQVTAAVWVINMAIPYAVLSSFAHLQGTDIGGIPSTERELLNLFCQLLQLGSTFFIINTSLKKYQPLPKPWYLFEWGIIPVFQALATAIAATGSGVLLAGLMTGHVDGQEEWRHLAGLHQDDVGSIALVLGALVLAPAVEEYYFRGYVLPSMTKWVHPLAAVPLTGLLFASAHPADSFIPEALLGTILSMSLLAADGNMLVPLMAHSLYNFFVLGTEYLL